MVLWRTICPFPASTAKGGLSELGKSPKKQWNRERAGQQDSRDGTIKSLGLSLLKKRLKE
jgi:hypothetical protein